MKLFNIPNLKSLLYGLVVVLIFLTSLVIYWLVYPYEVIIYPRTTNLTVVNKDLRVGENLKYVLNYCKLTNDISDVSMTLIGNSIISLPILHRSLPIGCAEKTIGDIFIPKETPKGEYYLSVIVQYKVNPIRVKSYQLETEVFNVK